ncbi:hypothetical protein KC992_00305 [Candidatus Saccharibacteria bacterium]|nr:hypothetical protein [Candidatus Saccharibacteria bacterium]
MKEIIRKKGDGISSFDTDDLALAAALLSKGYEMICMHPKEKSRSSNFSFVYHFVPTSTIQKVAEDWKNRKLKVDEKKFMAEVMNLNYEMIAWSSI